MEPLHCVISKKNYIDDTSRTVRICINSSFCAFEIIFDQTFDKNSFMQKLVCIPSCPHFKILSIGELQTLLKDQRNSFKKKSPQPVCVLLFQIRLIINAMIYQNVVKKSAKFKILSFFATKLDISQRIPIYNSVVAWILNFRIVLPAKKGSLIKVISEPKQNHRASDSSAKLRIQSLCEMQWLLWNNGLEKRREKWKFSKSWSLAR